MPYPNQHAARLVDPTKFEPASLRTIELGEGSGITAIVGRLKGEDKTTTQAIRFERQQFTPAEARKWLEEHDEKPIEFEPASERKDSAEPVQRYDVAPLLRSYRTPEGYLLAEGYAGRAGVLAYKRADGGVRYELIPPDELFRPDSLATLGRKPVTLQHPLRDGKPVQVDASNVGEFGVGDVDGELFEDAGGFVRVKVAVRRKDAVDAIESGIARGLSQGYTCDLDETPGTWEGQAYDAIQRNRRYNHLALCGMGRAGADARLRIDDQEVTIDGPEWPINEERKMDKPTASVEISGVRHDGLDPALAQAIGGVISERDSARTDAATHKAQYDALKKQYDTMAGQKETMDAEIRALKGQMDELNAKMVANQKKMEEATKGDGIDPAAFKARLELLTVAGKLGVEKADEMDSAGLRKAIVAAHNVDMKIDDKSEDYIGGACGLICESVLKADASHADAAALAAGLVGGKIIPPRKPDQERADAMAEYRKTVYGD
uniref:DUF2213 domain-containing protein n=1 Tax=viral metagenome TaxID=1070528 RepID=A0A6H1ZNA6_9ZZZZ